MSPRVDWLVKQVTCLTFDHWLLVTCQAELQVTPSTGLSRVETDQFTLLQLSLQPFHLKVNLWYKMALKERPTAYGIKL